MPSQFSLGNYSGVYTIENVVSGGIYVGSAGLFRRRFAQHKTALRGNKHSNSHLQNAWAAYGEGAFRFAVFIVCERKDMQFYEQKCLDVLLPRYNKSKSAYSGIPIGATLSAAHIEKLKGSSIRMWQDSAYVEKTVTAIRNAMTECERAKRSDRSKRLWANPVYRANAVAARKGNAYSRGYKCTPVQVLNRRKAARISNMKRNYGATWREEYVRRYPEFRGDISA